MNGYVAFFIKKYVGSSAPNITCKNKLIPQPKSLNAELNTFDKCIDYIISKKINIIIENQKKRMGLNMMKLYKLITLQICLKKIKN